GEYGSGEDEPDAPTAFPRDKVRYLDARELEIPYWLLSYAELIELLIDTDDPNASIQIAYLRGQVLNLKREAARDSDLGHVTVDSPVYFSLKELFEAFEKANRETTAFGKNKTPLYGKFDQLLVRLQSLFNDTRYDFLLQPKKRQTSESLAQLMRDFVGLGDPAANVTVLDLSAVPFDVAPIVTAQIGRLAYEFNYWNPRCDEFPILLVCEEAHEYIPRLGNPLHQQARRTIERIAKNGRKYGVGLCVISQRPHELSETVLSQCGTFLCLRISNPDDQEYVRKLVPDAARGILASLTALARGEVIAMGEAVPMPVRFRVTRPDPPPDSSDIDYAKQWAAGPRDISVEALVSRWRRQTR
ncbi:MAG: ATP-binding protein, partial [Xanthomonadales bacterium]|nr:ATP-binding protein [Xanthomonadales bacterium]